ncbi:acyl-CoA dehydrogenase family protein [Nocardioides baculatus]|uniref:Acyl-CoA dehydrogenase family protein n=1 Tax=Nocardioides baculatus TaxID=2801337 RepID=A0ABS1LCB7_9ACTN|nr:acyl-CoA dehydrogenase family protein [Nocardioides baculatus]MBL0749319.1 acyl-CoA dehydrogenase family protein [Nocardioides baculatus]
MTTLRVRPALSRNSSSVSPTPPTAASVDWAEIFSTVGEGALQRELDGELPVEAVRLLKAEGFGALRVPTAFGGGGVGLVDLARLWIELAAVDANLPQAFRGHFALVEDRLWHHARSSDQRVWFDRFVAGEMAGNAWSEVGSDIDLPRTVIRPRADGSWRLDGTKYYTTGTIFAEWADVHVRVARPGHPDEVEDPTAIALVDTRDPGVSVTDDWNGFGQKGTGSGTTTFDNVGVPADHVLPFEERFPYQTAFYQLNLLATLTGIAKSALADVVDAVQKRTRNFSHANAPRVRDDAQVLARIGEIAAAVYAAEAATLRVAASVQAVADAVLVGDDEVGALVEASEIESSTAQVVVSELVLRATSDVFDALGASATARPLALDRHWRNARTVASHNPRILKARVVGAHVVNGTPPPYAWSIGGTRRRQDWTEKAPQG